MLLEFLLALSIFSQNPGQVMKKVSWWPYYTLKSEQEKQKQHEQKVIAPIPILCYHWIVPKGHKVLSNARRYAQTTEEFKTTIRNYKKKGYKFITVTELDSIVSSYDSAKINLEDTIKYALITIDDGLKTTFTDAYPILLSEEVKATLFVTNCCIKDSIVKNNPYLSWQELREMYRSGLIDIQSHTYNSHFLINNTNPAVTTKKPGENDEDYIIRLFEDFKKSKDEIENKIGNGHKVIALAWPFGAYNKTSKRISEIVGFKITFGVNGEKFNIEKLKDYIVFPRIEVHSK